MTLEWFRSIMKTQLISSAGDLEVTCLVHKTFQHLNVGQRKMYQ